MTTTITRPRTALLLCFFGLLFAANAARAALIPGFGLEAFPNFFADQLVVAYDVETDALFVVGVDNVTLELGDEAFINPIGGTGYKLSLTGPRESVHATGSLSITGEFPELGYTSGTLLTGDVIEFGWIEPEDGASPYELQVVLAITGGDAAELFGPTMGIGLAQTAFPGNWDADWVNAGFGHSVTAEYAPVPVPGALVLFASGLLGLARLGARRDAKHGA